MYHTPNFWFKTKTWTQYTLESNLYPLWGHTTYQDLTEVQGGFPNRAFPNPERRPTTKLAVHSHISPDEFARVNEQLEYIDEHDEHADISTGDRVIDDSLIDQVLDNTETNSAAVVRQAQGQS
ncbi:hypothetical protein B0H17DRAFT_1135501 [Mycena rosella]|uniref:Uncharacterized protein n=1 Tax=Mycena rosella TaxID=1033263 RepID=A0AAD7DDI3_MYCRO|nr:hypothetical protein B0H17DRAFT_1135501 [Mycena rosella]